MSNPLNYLTPTPPPQGDTWYWALVDSLNPLRVALDRDGGNVLAVTPDALVGRLEEGDRVRLHVRGRRATITGRAGGQRELPPLDPPPALRSVRMNSTESGRLAAGVYDWLGEMSVIAGTNFGPFVYDTQNGRTNGNHMVATMAGVFGLDVWLRLTGTTADNVYLKFVVNGNVVGTHINREGGSGTTAGHMTMQLNSGDKFGVQQYIGGAASYIEQGQWTGLAITFLGGV